MIPAQTLVELLVANSRVDRQIGYLEAADIENVVSYQELHHRALGLLWHLQKLGARRGDHLIICLNNNEAFIDGFWAALAGGIIPVPLAVGISDEHRHKLLRVAAQLGNPFLYTDRRGLQRLADLAGGGAEKDAAMRLAKRALLIDELPGIDRRADPVDASPGDVAFIQYSSGSTSAPKGVVLTHANILANVRGATEAVAFTEDDISLSWMPLTHDMGLIGMFIMMFTNRMQIYLMPTELFIRRPLLWTSFLSGKRATLTSSPNFGYRHYLKVLGERQLEAIDLSSVRLIFNGAEPISVPLCHEFIGRLAPAGLRHDAMLTVYGLAEASLAMTLPEPGAPFRSVHLDRHHLRTGEPAREVAAGSPDALQLAVLGPAVPYSELRIADDADQPLGEGRVGHVQIRGDNVTAGYFDAPDINAAAFTDGGWLRTGDLGLMRQGELVITGRDKEIIFVNGQNYFPHDLEDIAGQAEGLELGKVAATGFRPPGAESDQLVLFVLHRGTMEQFLPVALDVSKRVNEHAGLEVAQVVPVRRIPKTTSGKIQRVALEESLAAGEFADDLARLAELMAAGHGAAASGELERRILDIVFDVLPDKRVDVEDNLFEVGASSLDLIQIHEKIDRMFPGQVDLSELFDYPSVRQLAAHLKKKAAG